MPCGALDSAPLLAAEETAALLEFLALLDEWDRKEVEKQK
jgi:hypothetical protein